MFARKKLSVGGTFCDQPTRRRDLSCRTGGNFARRSIDSRMVRFARESAENKTLEHDDSYAVELVAKGPMMSIGSSSSLLGILLPAALR